MHLEHDETPAAPFSYFALHLLLIAVANSVYADEISERAVTTAPPPIPSQRFCGITWKDASARCARRCPRGENIECGHGERCFDHAESCETTNGPSLPKNEQQGTSDNEEKKSATTELWEWLGPTLGAVSTVVGSLIAVFCVREQKEKKERVNQAAHNDTMEEYV